MIILGFIIYILLVVLLGISALLYLSPILMGLVIIIIANAMSNFKRGKMAPVLWNVVTIVVTIFATVMLWKDIFDDAIDTGPLPFIILALYGLGSLIAFSVPEAIREGRDRRKYQELMTWEELPIKVQKRIRTSRIVAIICTVMACVGTIAVITEDTAVGESLPPTILFAVVAIICWIIATKKHYKYCAGTSFEPMPKEVLQVFDKEYKKLLDEELPKACDWKQDEVWEDYLAPDYDAVHTYCEVAFDDSGRTFYYRTRNPKLKVGDAVYVPFGHNAPKRIGVIVSLEEYTGHDALYPLERTKFIIGKA